MKTLILMMLASLALNDAYAAANVRYQKTHAIFLKKAIAAQDAPAACWYLGRAEGYIHALALSGNVKAEKFESSLNQQEGKCGGVNSMDLKTTFTTEEWSRLSSVANKIEKADL